MSLSSLSEDAPSDDPSPTDRVRRRRRRSRWSRFKRTIRYRLRNRSRATSIGFTVVVLLVAFGAFRLVGAQQDLKAAEDAFLTARDAVSETRTDDAAEALEDASDRLDAAKSKAGGFPLGIVRPIPVIGSPAKAVTDVVKAGRELVAAGRVINDAAAAFPTSGEVAIDGHDLSAFHQAAVEADEALVRARRHVRRARAAVVGPAGAFLPPISKPARSAMATVDDAAEQLGGADRGLQLLADLTAPTTSARILVLSQDTLELRPTGGFVGSFGLLNVSDGRIDLSDFRATEELRSLPDPPGLPVQLRNADWGVENAMWWPDFPTSASRAADVFTEQTGIPVDGVLAVTENLLADLVGVFGPVSVPGYAEPVSGENFAERVLYEVEVKRPQDKPRKLFLSRLAEVVLDHVFDLPPSQVADVAKVLKRRVGTRDLQMWFRSTQLQSLIEKGQVAGRLPNVDDDFLMLVESNQTASKANRGLTRSVSYTVRREDDRLVAQLDIAYASHEPRSEFNPYYNGYLRVYVPAGSDVLEGASHAGRALDGSYAVLSRSVFVPPQEQLRVRIRYRLPKRIDAGKYGLRWQRQPGTASDPVSLVIGGGERVIPPGTMSAEVREDLSENPVRRYLRQRWIGRFFD